MNIGELVKNARINARMSVAELAAKIGRSRQYVYQLENGTRGVERSPHIIAHLETVLGLAAGSLADQLPPEHAAKAIVKMVTVEIPVVGHVGAGPAREDAISGEFLSISDMFRGGVAYIVCGDSMKEFSVCDGDYVVADPEAQVRPGDIVVAWIEGVGAVVKRLSGRRKLVSSDGWSHQLGDSDHIYGKAIGVVRRL